MIFKSSLLLALGHAAQIFANPVSPQHITRALAVDDIIVLGQNGSATIMKDYEYADLQRRAEAVNDEFLERATTMLKRRKTKRACEQSSEVQVLTDKTFLNWDVAMSPVVSAKGGTTLLGISEGYSISNSLSVTATAGVTIESILSVSYSLAYTETWTTSSTTSFTFTVPDGQYGIVVSEPSVRRLTGNYFSGCTDSWKSEAFTSDTYTSQSYGGMQWPTGVIRLCNGTTYPIPYCIGNGTHS